MINKLLASDSFLSQLFSFAIFALCLCLPAYMSKYLSVSETWRILCPLLLIVGYSYVSYCVFVLREVTYPMRLIGRWQSVGHGRLESGKQIVWPAMIWYGGLVAVTAIYIARLTK